MNGVLVSLLGGLVMVGMVAYVVWLDVIERRRLHEVQRQCDQLRTAAGIGTDWRDGPR